ncbi:MAG: chemotaxis protein CheW [Chloroflexi bacterium]|nr:chemotaxis protein CheW [Chloroflexota bacterium]
MAQTAVDTSRSEQQLVVFDLASEAYGVDIGAVREIIRMQDITRVPRTPEFVEGVINLRVSKPNLTLTYLNERTIRWAASSTKIPKPMMFLPQIGTTRCLVPHFT